MSPFFLLRNSRIFLALSGSVASAASGGKAQYEGKRGEIAYIFGLSRQEEKEALGRGVPWSRAERTEPIVTLY